MRCIAHNAAERLLVPGGGLGRSAGRVQFEDFRRFGSAGRDMTHHPRRAAVGPSTGDLRRFVARIRPPARRKLPPSIQK